MQYHLIVICVWGFQQIPSDVSPRASRTSDLSPLQWHPVPSLCAGVETLFERLVYARCHRCHRGLGVAYVKDLHLNIGIGAVGQGLLAFILGTLVPASPS